MQINSSTACEYLPEISYTRASTKRHFFSDFCEYSSNSTEKSLKKNSAVTSTSFAGDGYELISTYMKS